MSLNVRSTSRCVGSLSLKKRRDKQQVRADMIYTSAILLEDQKVVAYECKRQSVKVEIISTNENSQVFQTLHRLKMTVLVKSGELVTVQREILPKGKTFTLKRMEKNDLKQS